MIDEENARHLLYTLSIIDENVLRFPDLALMRDLILTFEIDGYEDYLSRYEVELKRVATLPRGEMEYMAV